MNYIFLRPTGPILVVVIDAFSCMYYIFDGGEWLCRTHYNNANNFITAFNEVFKAPVIITDITSVDELTSLHPELFI